MLWKSIGKRPKSMWEGSKGKSKQFDTEHGDFPFEYKLAEVKDRKYDRGVMEHRQADADQDNQDFWLASKAVKKNVSKAVSKTFKEAVQTCVNRKTLVSSPSGGEPGQPRKCSHFQRRLTKSSIGASCNQIRNTNRGLRSYQSLVKRNLCRCNRRRLSRQQFREFKTRHKQNGACDSTETSMQSSQPCWPEKCERACFTSLKNQSKRTKEKGLSNLDVITLLKVSTLNVRGLIGEHAYVKKRLLVDIMKKENYDIMLLQETNHNRNSVETVNGYDFFFSTDVTPRDAVPVERAGVGVIVSKNLKHFIHDVTQISGRFISVILKSKGRNLCFSSCYAPHSGYDVDTKALFYDAVQEHVRKIKGIHFLGGDFNARLHYRYQSEEAEMGPYIFGRGCEYLEQISDYTLENRSFFVSFCLHNGFRIMNTYFSKQAKSYCTFRENTTEHGPDWNPRRYAQLGFWLVAEK